MCTCVKHTSGAEMTAARSHCTVISFYFKWTVAAGNRCNDSPVQPASLVKPYNWIYSFRLCWRHCGDIFLHLLHRSLNYERAQRLYVFKNIHLTASVALSFAVVYFFSLYNISSCFTVFYFVSPSVSEHFYCHFFSYVWVAKLHKVTRGRQKMQEKVQNYHKRL